MIRTSWQTSVAVVVVLLASYVTTRWLGRRRLASFSIELALVFSLIATWQYIGRFVIRNTEGAFEHAQTVWHLERMLHLPSEVAVQRLFLPHHTLIQVMNDYYSGVHFNSMWMFFIWLWWRHHEIFGKARTVVALTTLGCLLIQAVPVAPPRMFPQLGFVDTALVYGQSVYGTGGSGIANQLAAMPSVHVAWAAMLAYYVGRFSTSRWRWLVTVHFVVTVLVVVVTANHWWLDGVVAIAVMGVAMTIRWAWERLQAARSLGWPTPDPFIPLAGRR